MSANELRGEVDLLLEGQRFVLRPSHAAQLEVEKQTGKAIMALAIAATDGELTLTHAAIIATEFIRADGRSTGDQVASNVDVERIGELISEYGLMRVVHRIAIVLTNAVTGGCRSDGTPKGEALAPGTTETPGADKQGSRAPHSGGRRRNTGTRPRTNIGARSKSGGK